MHLLEGIVHFCEYSTFSWTPLTCCHLRYNFLQEVHSEEMIANVSI